MSEAEPTGSRVNYTALHCEKCGHTWCEEMRLPMLVDAFVSRLKGWMVCPACGFTGKGKGRAKKSILLLTGDRHNKAVDAHLAAADSAASGRNAKP